MIEFRVGDLAEKLGVHRNTVGNWIKSGALRASSVVAKKYSISEEEFIRFCKLQGISESVVSQFVVRDFHVISKEERMPQQTATVSEPRTVGQRDSILRTDPQWGRWVPYLRELCQCMPHFRR